MKRKLGRMKRARHGEYAAVHRRLRTKQGPAKDHACRDCGAPAAEWSYDNADLRAQVDRATGCRLSHDLAHYAPRCVSCHRRADRNHRQGVLTPAAAAMVAERERIRAREHALKRWHADHR